MIPAKEKRLKQSVVDDILRRNPLLNPALVFDWSIMFRLTYKRNPTDEDCQ